MLFEVCTKSFHCAGVVLQTAPFTFRSVMLCYFQNDCFWFRQDTNLLNRMIINKRKQIKMGSIFNAGSTGWNMFGNDTGYFSRIATGTWSWIDNLGRYAGLQHWINSFFTAKLLCNRDCRYCTKLFGHVF